MNGERLTLNEAEVLVHHYFPKCPICKSEAGYDFSEIGGINYLTFAQCLACEARWVVWKDRMELKEASIDGAGSDLVGQSYPFPEAEAVLKRKMKRIRKPSKIKEEKIKTYDRTIERLTILFSKGEISEESYKKAIKTVEEKLNKLRGKKEIVPVSSKKQVTPSWPSRRYIPSKPSSLWYLLPLFFGILGGVVGYIGVKDEDKEMANNLLYLGIAITILAIFFYVLAFAAILQMLASY